MNTLLDIYNCIKENNISELDKLLKLEKDIYCIRPYSQSLLLHATFENSIQIVNYLVKKGFDINEKDIDGYTPLHAASENNFSEIVQYLINNGAHVNIKDKWGNTPLLKSIQHWDRNRIVIKLLLENGANPDEKNKFGTSTRSLCLKMNANEILELFDAHRK